NKHFILFSLKQNEMFIFPDKKGEFNPKEVDLMDPRNKEKISPNLFRVQKIASKDYLFTSHLETKAVDGAFMKNNKDLSGVVFHRIRSANDLEGIVKVRLNHLGDIVSVGEY